MSTTSFAKEVIVKDKKAIEQFLYDLENAKRSKATSIELTPKETTQKQKVLALLKERMKKL